MAKDNCQKIKLLKLMEILRQETDEQHPLRATEICNRLVSLGITCDRRTLTKDIALLNEQGFEVMTTMISHEKGYYIEDRSFSVPELKILIDAVQAASFVTEKKTAELIEKIASLGGSHCAEILKSNRWHSRLDLPLTPAKRSLSQLHTLCRSRRQHRASLWCRFTSRTDT